jgi:hypothetical protein
MPFVPNARQGTFLLSLKEVPRSQSLFFLHTPHPFNSIHPRLPQWFNHHRQRPVQMEIQGNWIKTRRTSSPIDAFEMPLTFHQLVNNDTKAVVVESHRRVTGNGGFIKTKTPRSMNLDIADEVAKYADFVLLTFLLVWNERVSERAKYPPAERFSAPDLTSIILMGSH